MGSREDLNMAELGLKKKEVDAIDFAFDVYDFKGDGQVDAFYAGDLMRACNINPTMKTIAAIGGQSEKGKKMLSKADCYPMFKAAKESKDQGGFHDFVEILKPTTKTMTTPCWDTNCSVSSPTLERSSPRRKTSP